MKKRIVILCVCLMLIASLLLVACEGANVCRIDSIEGIGDAKIDNDAKTVTLNVAPEVTIFDLATIKVPKEIKIEAFTDKECASAIAGNILLNYGLNTFFVRLSATEKKKTVTFVYEFRVTKLEPAIPDREITGIKLNNWKSFYSVNEAFASSKLALVYKDMTNFLIDITPNMLTGFDTTTVGRRDVTVTYGKFTVKGKITVGDPDNVVVEDVPATIISEDAIMNFFGSIEQSIALFESAPQSIGSIIANIKNSEYMLDCISVLKDGVQKAGITEAQLATISNAFRTIIDNIALIGDEIEFSEISDFYKIIQLFVKDDPSIVSIKKEVATIVDSFTETQLGFVIKAACQFVDEMMMEEYNVAIANFDIDNVNNASDIKALISRQIEMYRNNLKTYKLEDIHYVTIAHRLKEVVYTLTNSDTATLGKLANTAFAIYDAISNEYGIEAITELLKTPGTSLSEAAVQLHEVGEILEGIALSWSKDTFSRLFDQTGLPGTTSITGMVSIAMVVGENSADGIKAVAKILKNVTAEDLTTIYADLDDALKEKEMLNGAANPLYTQKMATLVLRVQQFLSKNFKTFSQEEMTSLKYIVELIDTTFSFTGVDSDFSKVFALVDELNAYTIEEVSVNFDKANEVMNKLNTLVEYSTKDYIEVSLDNPTYNDMYDNAIDVPKGATKEDVVKIINDNCTIEFYQYDGIDFLGTTIMASVDNIVADTSKTGFTTFSVSIKLNDVITTAPFIAYVYDENSYKEFSRLNNYDETTKIYSCAIGATPTYPISSAFRGIYYSTAKATTTVNEILSGRTYNCAGAKFSLDDYNSGNVTMIYDTTTSGLKTGYLIQTDPILGAVILPFKYFVEYPEGTAIETLMEIIGVYNRETFAINTDPLFDDYGSISYTLDGGVTEQTYFIEKTDITGLDLAKAGEQKITITALGKTFTKYIYVMIFDESKRISKNYNMHWTDNYLKGATELIVDISLSFSYDGYGENMRNVLEWNQFFSDMKFGYVMEVEGFDTSTIGERFATILIKDASGNIVFSTSLDYEVCESFSDIKSFIVTSKNVFTESELTQDFILKNIGITTRDFDNREIFYIMPQEVHNLLAEENGSLVIEKNAGFATLTFSLAGKTYSMGVRVIKDTEKNLITSIRWENWHENETVIIQGNEWAVGSFSLNVYYGYGYKVETVSVGDPNVIIKGFDKNKVGFQNIIISYLGFEGVVKVNVITAAQAQEVTGADYDSSQKLNLAKTDYIVGEELMLFVEFDSSLCVVRGYGREYIILREYQNRQENQEKGFSDLVESTTFDNTKVGKQTVKITFKGGHVAIEVEVNVSAK